MKMATLAAIPPGAADTRRGGGIEPAVLGLALFLGSEVMFFAGLISAFLILKAGAGPWPPPGQPRLPVLVTGINTAFLLLSGCAILLAIVAIRRGAQRRGTLWLAVTAALGTVFLAVQGFECVRLLGCGLSLSSGTYGATFYALNGAHGVHVLAALVVLLFVLSRAMRGRYTSSRYIGVVLCAMYWSFVVAVWPLLYALVYFA